MAVIKKKKALVTYIPLQSFVDCNFELSVFDIEDAKHLAYDYYFIVGSMVQALNSKGFNVSYEEHMNCNFAECSELYYVYFINNGDIGCIKVIVNE